MAHALVSIVIVNWNGRKFLGPCLTSIFSQEYSPFEIVLVDNGSTDGSVEFLKEKFPSVKIIKNDKNLGFAEANNQGIDASRGDFILTLNNDTELHAGFLSELMSSAIDSEGSTGMWAPKILSLSDRNVIDSVGGLLIYRDGLAKGRGRLEKDRGQYDSAGEVLFPSACAALYRKKLLEEVGGFDADFFAYCEDTDLGLRARLAGWKAASVPRAVVYHYYSGTGGRYTPFKACLVERNRLWVAIKNFPLPMLGESLFYTLWRYIVQAYGVLSGKGAGGRFAQEASAFGLVPILAKAYIDAARGLPAVLKKRSAIKRASKAKSKDIKALFRAWSASAAETVLKD